MEVSSNSMNVARVTVSATAQGLTPGFMDVRGAATMVWVVANLPPAASRYLGLRFKKRPDGRKSVLELSSCACRKEALCLRREGQAEPPREKPRERERGSTSLRRLLGSSIEWGTKAARYSR